MKYFYKIQNNKAIIGSGTKLPDNTFIEYDKDNKPQELIEALNYKTPEELLQQGERLVEDFIQKEVDKFNEANSVKFSNMHAVALYKDSDTYPLADECKSLWDWNESVWVTARANMTAAIEEKWDEATFTASLPTKG